MTTSLNAISINWYKLPLVGEFLLSRNQGKGRVGIQRRGRYVSYSLGAYTLTRKLKKDMESERRRMVLEMAGKDFSLPSTSTGKRVS